MSLDLGQHFKTPAATGRSALSDDSPVMLMDVLVLHVVDPSDQKNVERMATKVDAALIEKNGAGLGGWKIYSEDAKGTIKNSNGVDPIACVFTTSNPQEVMDMFNEKFGQTGRYLFLGATQRGEIVLPQNTDTPIPHGVFVPDEIRNSVPALG